MIHSSHKQEFHKHWNLQMPQNSYTKDRRRSLINPQKLQIFHRPVFHEEHFCSLNKLNQVMHSISHIIYHKSNPTSNPTAQLTSHKIAKPPKSLLSKETTSMQAKRCPSASEEPFCHGTTIVYCFKKVPSRGDNRAYNALGFPGCQLCRLCPFFLCFYGCIFSCRPL